MRVIYQSAAVTYQAQNRFVLHVTKLGAWRISLVWIMRVEFELEIRSCKLHHMYFLSRRHGVANAAIEQLERTKPIRVKWYICEIHIAVWLNLDAPFQPTLVVYHVFF
jgi:hypothetical protein